MNARFNIVGLKELEYCGGGVACCEAHDPDATAWGVDYYGQHVCEVRCDTFKQAEALAEWGAQVFEAGRREAKFEIRKVLGIEQ